MLDYDREAARYDATRGGDARAQAAADAIETLLTGMGAARARIVDVGCGTGIVTVRLARPGRSVAGVERSGGMAAVAATRLPGQITLGDHLVDERPPTGIVKSEKASAGCGGDEKCRKRRMRQESQKGQDE